MKNILITGGSGSFGQAFTSRLLKNGVDRIVIYSRGEHRQEEMARKFQNNPKLRFFIGCVRDFDRLTMAMRGVDTVIHAAALKIIPTCEYNPYESVQTNVIGAQNVCKAAIEAGVKRAIAISTDKACEPLNIYGATKMVSEKLFLSSNHVSAGRTKFSAVRYGNVDGSAGSVLPLFKRLAADGKRLPITDPRMTRFSISMDKAIDLVIAAVKGPPETIWIPKLPSYRITDVAQAVSNLEPIYMGIRPGEKIHETLISEAESRLTKDVGQYFIINGTNGKQIQEDFRYSSGTNSKWLTLEELKTIVDALPS